VLVVAVVVVVLLLLLHAEQLPLAAGQHQHQHEPCKGSYGAEQLLWRVASRGDRWFWCGCCVIASRACAL
jgi:preprotein translocase subunit SecG